MENITFENNQILLSLLVALITIVITNIFNYIFSVKKEMRLQAAKYKVDILEKVYTPILRLMIRNIIPGDGYEGIGTYELSEIRAIVNKNLNLVDPQLEYLVYSAEEDEYISSMGNNHFQIDTDRELLDYVIKQYNTLRKNLGLPYERMWTGKARELVNFHMNDSKLKRWIRKKLI